MKKVLIIGSTVVDIIINVDFLPKTSQDVHVISQKMSLGGCAYNVSDAVRHFNVQYILFSPVGTGIYGDFVRKELDKRNIDILIPTPNQDNGCCYCFVESSGERTFISNHGAEYLIYSEWLNKIDISEIDSIYVCGLEIEEETGNDVVQFLENARKLFPNINIFFAPGPRITLIAKGLIDRILKLKPILHLNEEEVILFTTKDSMMEAIIDMQSLTDNTVIVTCAESGAYFYEGKELIHVPAVDTEQVDTIGAGDSHIGSVIACLAQGKSMYEAISSANKVAAAVVETEGATLTDEKFNELNLA